MTADQESGQREAVAGKYETVYSFLDYFAGLILAKQDVPDPQKYAQLKVYLSGLWGYIMSPDSRNRPLVGQELPARCLEYEAKPMTWSESGISREGTIAQFREALDGVWRRIADEHFDREADLVLDLGCGWGHRMFDFWRMGAAPKAKYRGGDRSDYSRKLVKQIGPIFPGLDIDWFPFDFLKPDFTEVEGNPKRVCLFTSAAIEQVINLGPMLFDRVIARFPHADITGIHLEPITFQFGDDYPAPSFVNVERDRHAAERFGYNLDLYKQVKTHPRLKITAIKHALLDTGTGNSFSLLVWRSV